MTLQNVYKLSTTISPNFPSNYLDGDVFSHIFVIPPEQITLNISTANKIDTFSTTPAQNVNNNTVDLFGTLVLSYSNIVLPTINGNTVVYYADFTTNSIIFDYTSTNNKLLKVGDTLLSNCIITKIVNLTGYHSYLEYSGTNTFTNNQIISVDDVSIRVLAGKGILDRAGIVGRYSTNYKSISYFAKFSDTPVTATTTTTAYSNYNLNLPNAFTSTNDNINNNRLSDINKNILESANTSISSISKLPTATFSNNNLGISAVSNNNLTVSNYYKIPHKTPTTAFGISDCSATVYQSFMDDITIKFNRTYTPVIPTTPYINPNPSVNGYQLVDGWLHHVYKLTVTGVGMSATTTDIPPSIIYTKSGIYISQIGYTNNNTTNVLFASNDVIYYITTHVLDYNTEPYGSSDVTNLRGIQNELIIPCLYTFDTDKIRDINDNGGNLDNGATAKIIQDFKIGDDIITVDSTTGFTTSGYLELVKYDVVAGVYTLVGVEYIYYSSINADTFTGVSRLSSSNYNYIVADGRYYVTQIINYI
jgi:hypothetical protein